MIHEFWTRLHVVLWIKWITHATLERMETNDAVKAFLSARSKKAAKTLRKKGGKKYFSELAGKRWAKNGLTEPK
jgi:hypothetical protein